MSAVAVNRTKMHPFGTPTFRSALSLNDWKNIVTGEKVYSIFRNHLDAEVRVIEHFPPTREVAHDPSFLCFVKTTTTFDFGGD